MAPGQSGTLVGQSAAGLGAFPVKPSRPAELLKDQGHRSQVQYSHIVPKTRRPEHPGQKHRQTKRHSRTKQGPRELNQHRLGHGGVRFVGTSRHECIVAQGICFVAIEKSVLKYGVTQKLLKNTNIINL